MTSQLGKQTIAIYTLSNISRSKGNQTKKFGHLIEYTIRNIFLLKSCTKCGEKINPRPFYKKSKLSISLDRQSVMLKIFLYVQVEDYQIILKLRY